MQRTKSKILSILLSLVMLLSLLPTTALAAGQYPAASEVLVDGNKYFGEPGCYYFKNGASACSKDPNNYNAYYNPNTGVLTLDGYNGGSIVAGGTKSKITVELVGNNSINGSLTSAWGGDITVTSSSGGTLSITNTLNDSNAAIGIETGYGPQTTGNVTITGNAQVKIDMTHNGTRGCEKAYGIFARENITISGDASVDIICKTQYNTARFGDYCNGLRTDKNVTIDTNGTIKIDVKTAGGDGAYSYGIYPVGSAILTKVGKMEVQWKKDGSSGRAVYGSASFNSAEYDTNETTATNVDGTTYYITTYTPKVAATITSVSATVSQPVKGHPLDTTVNVGTATAYTATVMWKDVEENMTATGDAKPGKIYTALITLRAKEGEAFSSSLHNTTTPGGYSIEWLNSTELLLTKEFERTQVKGTTGIAIDNTTLTVAVPTAEPNMEQKAELPLTAKVIYDDGTDETVEAFWSFVDPKPEGVDIDKTTGKLTVTNKAAGGEVEVKAAYNGMTDTKTVTITKEPAKEAKIVLTAPGSTTIDVPTGNGVKNNSGKCTAKVYDQYGMPITSAGVTYESDPVTMPTGVTFAPTTGEFFVDNTAQNGTVKVIAKYGTVASNPVAFTIKRAAGTVNSVTLSGSDPTLTVPEANGPENPKSKTVTNTYTATVKDQFGVTIPGESVSWSVSGNAGVTINSSTGELKISSDATADSVTITATCKDKSDSKTVSVTRTTPAAKWVKITGQNGSPAKTQFVIPAATGAISETSNSYEATVYDQYGKDYNENVDWSLYPSSVNGVTKEVSTTNTNVVTIKVDSNAIEGNFDIIATSSSSSAVNGKINLTLTNKTPASLTVTQADTTYGTALADPVYNKDNMIDSTLKVTYVGRGTTSYAENTARPTGAGTYTVKVTYETASQILSGSANFTIEPKTVDIPAVDNTRYTYDGTEKTYNIPTSPYYTVSGNKQTNAKEAGHIVTVTLTDTTNTTWSDDSVGQKIFMFRIMKATPTGEPKYTAITTSGKKLADAGLTTTGGTFSVPGTVKWVDDTTGADLLNTTTVEANKLYKWVFTPNDSTNYEPISGSIKLWSKSTSSGGYYYAPTAAVVPDMPMLYRGCTGDAVKTLQDKLNTLGYNSGNVDGIFGAKTYAAVTAFQKANSLGADGIVGKLTWGKLYGISPAMPVETTTVVGRPMVSYGSRGDAVRKLQELLNALGYDCGSVDGIFGSKTKAAVLAFQKANGLGADGIVGPLTWAKLG